MNQQEFRKRSRQKALHTKPSTEAIHKARKELKGKRAGAAMQIINDALATPNLSDVEQAKLLSAAIDGEAEQGRFSTAADYYQQLGSGDGLLAQEPRYWLRAAVGEIKNRLKGVELAAAREAARLAWQRAKQEEADYGQILEEAAKQARSGVVTEIPVRPHRAIGVARRLGSAFLEEGEIELAEEFFRHALREEPNACRARLGLAKIALGRNQFVAAEKLAKDALFAGNFRKKTTGAWSLYIQARQQQKKFGIDPAVTNALAKNKNTSAQAAATLEIIKGLRAYGDQAWMQISQSWTPQQARKHPNVNTEILKTNLSNACLQKVHPSEQKALALQLFMSPNASPQELLCAAKKYYRAGIEAATLDKSYVWPPLEPLRALAEERFGTDHADKVAKSAALGAMNAGNDALGITILEEILQRRDPSDELYRRTRYILARTHFLLKHHAEAARLYTAIASDVAVPMPYRVQALSRGLRSTANAGGASDSAQAVQLVRSFIDETDEPARLLDIALQVKVSGPFLKSAMQEVMAKVNQQVTRGLNEAATPELARACLLPFARKSVFDFHDYHPLVNLWNNLSTEKRHWLWTSKADYWEIISLVVRAYYEMGDKKTAMALAEDVMGDSATPSIGFAHVGSALGDLQMRSGLRDAGISTLRKTAEKSATQQPSGLAYYWLTLHAYKRQDWELYRQHRLLFLQTVGSSINLWWQNDCFQNLQALETQISTGSPTAHNGLQTDLNLL